MAGKVRRTSFREANDRLWEWRKSVTEEKRALGYYYDRQPKTDKGHYNELGFFRRISRDNQPSQTNEIRGAMASLIAWRAIDLWRKGQAVDLNFGYLQTL